MMHNELITKRDILSIGEEIGYELGAQMVKDYQMANPHDDQAYIIGRNIIDQILAQPGCVGIQFFYGYNEIGEKALVYIGLDQDGKAILQYSSVNSVGVMVTEKGIVADKGVRRPSSTTPAPTGIDEDTSWWDFE